MVATPSPFPCLVEELLPHARPMVLLDAIVAADANGLSATRTVRPDDRFLTPGLGVAAHIGVEWMAQACGAFAGLEARNAGYAPRLGFLLGTRRYLAEIDWFLEGERYVISVKQVFREGEMGVFDCSIHFGDGHCASAQLTVYQPQDAEAILSPESRAS